MSRLFIALDISFFCLLGFVAEVTSLWQAGHLGFAVLALTQPVLLAILLRGNQQERSVRLVASLLGTLFALLIGGTPKLLAAGLVLTDALQALTAALFIFSVLGGRRPDITRPYMCAVVLVCGGLLAPMAGSLLAASLSTVIRHADFLSSWRQYGFADAVGVLVCLPCLLVVKPSTLRWLSPGLGAVTGVAVAAAGIFVMHSLPLPHFLFPVLVIASFVDFATTMTCLLVAAVIVTTASVAGINPINMVAVTSSLPSWIVIQLFLLSTTLIVLPLALMLDERGRLMRLSEAALDQAMRKSEEKSRFIATVSHEIRTPMNGIIGFADLLGCTSLTDEQTEYVQKVQGAAASLLTLVNDLLDLSKVEAGRMAFQKRAFSLSTLCAEVLDVARVTPNAAGIRLSTSVDPSLPDLVEGDPVRVQQVLLNLVANALAHTEHGSVHIEVGRADSDPNTVRIEVHDTGAGIAEDRVHELFRPFAQLHDPRARVGGTGLGLAICKQIVEQMPGGAIGVQSQAGLGSLFWFELSLPPAHPGDEYGFEVPDLTGIGYARAVSATPEPDDAKLPPVVVEAPRDWLTGLPAPEAFGRHISELVSGETASSGFALAALRVSELQAADGRAADSVSDAVLRQVGACLQHAASGMLSFRGGNGGFMLILPGRDDDPVIIESLHTLQTTLSRHLAAAGIPHAVRFSAGIARFPQDACDESGLIAHAEAALSRAERSGPGSLRFFSAARDLPMQSRRVLMQDLREAIGTNALTLQFQPIARVSGSTAGFEALVRWSHPVHGSVPPDQFVRMAEECGVILPLSRWILRAACAEAVSWSHELTVSVNISPMQFWHENLPDLVRATLRETGLAASLLVLEVTGGALVANPDQASRVLQELARIGVQISLDDFGTGTSPLSHLDRYPFTELKLDRYFTAKLGLSRRAEDIARSIITLAHSLHLRVVAEGVETQDQFDFFAAAGCDLVQGYLIGQPRDIDAYAGIVRPAAALAQSLASADSFAFRPVRATLH